MPTFSIQILFQDGDGAQLESSWVFLSWNWAVLLNALDAKVWKMYIALTNDLAQFRAFLNLESLAYFTIFEIKWAKRNSRNSRGVNETTMAGFVTREEIESDRTLCVKRKHEQALLSFVEKCCFHRGMIFRKLAQISLFTARGNTKFFKLVFLSSDSMTPSPNAYS